MKQKLKGCRPSEQVRIELSNRFMDYGAAKHRLEVSLPKDIETLNTTIKELHLELMESMKQEEANKASEPTPSPHEEPSLLEVVQ